MMVAGEMLSGSTRKRVFLILTNVLSIACLIWTLHDAQLGELKDDIASMDWKWVAIACLTDVLVYLWHAVRWGLILRPIAAVKYWDTVRAIYVGLFANEVLPLRAGEVVRCYLQSRWAEIPLSVTISSALIERIFDGVWLCAGLVFVMRYWHFPPSLNYLVDGAYFLGVIVLTASILLGLALFHKDKKRVAYSSTPWRRNLQVLYDDLGFIGHSRYLYLSAIASAPYLLIQVLPIYAAMQGYSVKSDRFDGFDVSLGAAFALMVVLRLAAVVPQAPGNIGFFQLITKVTLIEVFKAAPDEAARFSLVLWGIVTLPLMVVGFVALLLTGSKLSEIHSEATKSAAERSAVLSAVPPASVPPASD